MRRGLKYWLLEIERGDFMVLCSPGSLEKSKETRKAELLLMALI